MTYSNLFFYLLASGIILFEVVALPYLAFYIARDKVSTSRFITRLNSIMADSVSEGKGMEDTVEKIGIVFRRLNIATISKNAVSMMEEAIYIAHGGRVPKPFKNWSASERTYLSDLLNEMKNNSRYSGLSPNFSGAIESLRQYHKSDEDRFSQSLNQLVEQIYDLESKYSKTKRSSSIFGIFSIIGVLLPLIALVPIFGN